MSLVLNKLSEIYENLGIPDSCILGKRIFKKQFYENGQLNAADKKAFIEDVDKIEWSYTLKPATINISRLEDDDYEYLEVAFLQITLLSANRYNRIAEVVQKAIPYPIIILFHIIDDSGEQVAFNAADKRINRSDSDKIVIEAMFDTNWIDLENLQHWQIEFLRDFKLKSFSHRNFYLLYQDMVNRIVAFCCARHTGSYYLSNEDTKGIRLEGLKQIEKLQQEQTVLRNKLKREKNLGTRVELSTRNKNIADRITSLKVGL